MLKVYHLSYADNIGGAAKATFRVHKALKKYGIQSKILVNKSITNDPDIIYTSNLIEKNYIKLKPRLIKVLSNFLITKNQSLHSPSLIPSNWHQIVNNSNVDIVNLHWVQKEMISIKNISQIRKPLVWTFHDMWPFCGAEHVSSDNRWINGYKTNNRPPYESGFDLNKFIWNKKLKFWNKSFSIITPSKWMAECVHKSFLFKNSKVKVIPHCIDLDFWSPINKKEAKQLLGIQKDIPLLLAGTLNSNDEPNKGFDLLKHSLSIFKKYNLKVNIAVFGQREKHSQNNLSKEVLYLGTINEDTKMRIIYSAADLVMVPSRIESFSNIAMEAQCCGTPVVSFSTSGLKDVVEHKKTGYLAKPFEAYDFAKGLYWCLNQSSKNNNLGKQARLRSKNLWNEKKISNSYKEYYEEIISDKNYGNSLK